MSYGFDTMQLHAGQKPDGETGARALPIYQTTSYCFPDAAAAAGVFDGSVKGYTYTRIENPTVEALESRMAALERGAAAVAFSSGMAAISAAVYALCSCGDNIVSISTLYGGTHTLFSTRLPQVSGISTRFVDPDDLAAMERAIDEHTRMIYLETICNPNINIPDFDAVVELAHKHGLPVVLDNTFGMPPIFDARAHGIDIVIHSLSKYAGGHGNSIGGCVVDMGTFDFHGPRFKPLCEPDALNGGVVYADTPAPVATRLRNQMLREFGACLSPMNAFLIMQGLETLSLRIAKHCESARKVAEFLNDCPKVEYVKYPMLEGDKYHERAKKYLPNGAGAIMSFGIKGGIEAGREFINRLKLFSLLANIADAKSLVIHPASTTHGQMSEAELAAAGVAPELIRLSIGLESIEDIIDDLRRGFDA